MPSMTHAQIEGHTVGYDDAWVDFSWPRPRDSPDGHLDGGAMMEGTRDDVMMVWLGDRVH